MELEVLSEGWVGLDVEEDGSFGEEVRGSTWLCVEVGSKSLGENMDGGDDLVAVGFTNIAVLHKKVLGILGKVRGHEDTEGRGAVILQGGWVVLWIPEPSQVAAIELDMLGRDRERIIFRVGWID